MWVVGEFKGGPGGARWPSWSTGPHKPPPRSETVLARYGLGAAAASPISSDTAVLGSVGGSLWLERLCVRFARGREVNVDNGRTMVGRAARTGGSRLRKHFCTDSV